MTYHELGRHSDDKQLTVGILKLRQELLGEQHSDTIRTMAHLGRVHRRQGLYNEAEQLQTRALELQQELLGNENGDTVRTMSELG